MKMRTLFFIIAFAVMLTACTTPTSAPAPASKPVIEVSDLWVRAVAVSSGMGTPSSGGMNMSGPTSAAYMILKNSSGVADRLIKAQTDVVKTVEIHTTMKEGDVMKMKPVEGIDIPANGQAKLEPGGFHVMLIGVTRELKAGDKIKLTLVFEKAGEIVLEAPVRAP
jgi:copper(I)-binding protein